MGLQRIQMKEFWWLALRTGQSISKSFSSWSNRYLRVWSRCIKNAIVSNSHIFASNIPVQTPWYSQLVQRAHLSYMGNLQWNKEWQYPWSLPDKRIWRRLRPVCCYVVRKPKLSTHVFHWEMLLSSDFNPLHPTIGIFILQFHSLMH